MAQLNLVGVLTAHSGWVTSIATPFAPSKDDNLGADPNLLITGSRDKTVVKWELADEPEKIARAVRSFTGHSHFVEDVIISKDGQFALSASWDSTLRLWDLEMGSGIDPFVGHSSDVLSVSFSPDNRQIVSGSRDKSIRLWNTLGDCKVELEDAHSDWVSCVKFSPNPNNPFVISAGWDKLVKIWRISNKFKLDKTLPGHTGYINAVAVAPDGSLCASGGRDRTAMLWDTYKGELLVSLDAGDIINCLEFSPNKYWLCAGTDSGVMIWDLEDKKPVGNVIDQEAFEEDFKTDKYCPYPGCTSLAWSHDGTTLYTGWTDGKVRVFSTGTSLSQFTN